MRLSTRQDIDAPLDEAFAAISDFDYLERQILRRGIQIVRTDDLSTPGPGMAWRGDMTLRGQVYDVRCRLAEWTAPGPVPLGLRLLSLQPQSCCPYPARAPRLGARPYRCCFSKIS